jgi:hypothetical protein
LEIVIATWLTAFLEIFFNCFYHWSKSYLRQVSTIPRGETWKTIEQNVNTWKIFFCILFSRMYVSCTIYKAWFCSSYFVFEMCCPKQSLYLMRHWLVTTILKFFFPNKKYLTWSSNSLTVLGSNPASWRKSIRSPTTTSSRRICKNDWRPDNRSRSMNRSLNFRWRLFNFGTTSSRAHCCPVFLQN